MRSALRLAVAALVLALLVPRADAKKAPLCEGGRFLGTGPPVLPHEGAPIPTHLGPGEHHDTILITPSAVSIEGLCPPTKPRVRRTKRHTTIVAKWRACGTLRRVRLKVRLDGATCSLLQGKVRARKPRMTRVLRASLVHPDAATCAGRDTFALVQERIFGPRGCRVQTCHGAYGAGNLDLQSGAAYKQLVGVLADNPVAAAAGTLRVAPGDPDGSFLWQKLAGSLDPGEGDPMPLVGQPLDPLERSFLRAWIAAGAPETGEVAGAGCVQPREYEPTPALAPPPGGHQIVLDGPILQPGQEQEGCMWVEVPGGADFLVGRWEYAMNPGTHHFAVWDFVRDGSPTTGVWRPGDIACTATGARFGISESGAPEAPYFVDAYPPGVGKLLKAGSYLGLNAHYYNEFDVPIQMKVWINLYPVAGPVQHIADTITSISGELGGLTGYNGIDVAPYTQRALRLRYRNTFGRPMAIFQMSSHMHKRGIGFTAWRSDGSVLYENADFAHPRIRVFDPPLVVPPGDWIDYECVHDNGVTREVRRCGDAPADRDCTPGDPRTLVFGVSAEDEMCFLTGLYYLE